MAHRAKDNLVLERESASARSPHAIPWALTLVIGLPLLYLLSVAPVQWLTFHYGRYPVAPAWLLHYSEPAEWVQEHTPLKRPLGAYAEWWSRLRGPRS
jgi:hypothetical protein